MKKSILYAIILLSVIMSSCNNSNDSNSFTDKDNYNLDTVSYVEIPGQNPAMNPSGLYYKLSENLKKISIDSVDYYVVEGDLLMDEDELYQYCVKRVGGAHEIVDLEAKKMTRKFTMGVLPNGNLSVWPQNYIIKYAILRRSFSSAENYQMTIELMNQAVQDWMGLCNVKFQYLPAYDNGVPGARLSDSLTFVVREFNAGGAFIAQAFFPNDPPMERRLLIDPTYYTTPISRAGILRHEIGHILGCRHEHIWSKETDCQGENIIEDYLGAQQLTTYDPYSVMHYLCGGVGSSALGFTSFDSAGAKKIFGDPIH